MVEEFNPKKKKAKVKISVSIDEELDKMIQELVEKHKVNYSRIVNEMLIYFKKQFYNKFKIKEEDKKDS